MSTIRTTLASLATIALLGGGLAGCGGEDAAEEPATPAPSSAESSEEPPAEPPDEPSQEPEAEAPAEAMITIEDFTFSDPGPVAAGAEITVENVDDVTHTVTADDGDFDVSVGAGETVTFTAPTGPGDYGYFCEPHPGMTATLVVE